MTLPLPAWLEIRCPSCGAALPREGDELRCAAGHRFAVRRGIAQLHPGDRDRPPPRYVRWIHDYYRVPFSGAQRRRTARLIEEFLRFTEPGTPVLDVGCGRTDKAALFPPGTYVGIDPIDPLAAGMVDDLPAPMVCGLGERLPFADGQFGSVMLFAVTDHVRDRRALFAECARVLRPGGSLCLMNQVTGLKGSTARGVAGWILHRLRTGDFRGILAVARFSLASPSARAFTEALTADRLLGEIATAFHDVRSKVVDGHALLVRATR